MLAAASPLSQRMLTISPPANLLVFAVPARVLRDALSQAEKYSGIRNRVTHESGKEIVRIDDRQLAAVLGGFNVDPFGFEARAQCIPVSDRWHQYDAFSICERRGCEAACSAIKKLLVLIQLNYRIAWSRIR